MRGESWTMIRRGKVREGEGILEEREKSLALSKRELAAVLEERQNISGKLD